MQKFAMPKKLDQDTLRDRVFVSLIPRASCSNIQSESPFQLNNVAIPITCKKILLFPFIFLLCSRIYRFPMHASRTTSMKSKNF